MSVVNIVADLPELIEKGQTVECLVRFYDRSGSILPARENGAPDLAAKIKEGRITINLSSNETNNGILYTVTGNFFFFIKVSFIQNSMLNRFFSRFGSK